MDQSASGANSGASWANAYLDLQSALTDSATCTTVRVAQGTYKPTATGDRGISFAVKPGVKVYGGYPAGGGAPDPAAHPTILSGDIGTPGDDSDNSEHVVLMDGSTGTPITAGTVLDGFTITLGRSEYAGGGLLCEAEGAGAVCSPSLSRLVFVDNQAKRRGGGMSGYANDGGVASPTPTEVTFRNNHAEDGGGFSNLASTAGTASPLLTKVVFQDNHAHPSGGGGGAIYNRVVADDSTGSPTLVDVDFDGNSAAWGGGMYNVTDSGTNMQCHPTLTNVTFSGNSAQWGGAISNSASRYGTGPDVVTLDFVLTNATFSNNRATTGGGAIANSGVGENVLVDARMTNVTFSGNQATPWGGAIAHSAHMHALSKLALVNVISWGNSASTGPEIFNDDESTAYAEPGTTEILIDYSIIEGGDSGITRTDGTPDPAFSTGTGNIDADPKLGTLADHGGFTPTVLPGSGSAAIDAGDTISGLAIDQRGVHRPQGAAYDIGAVEGIDVTASHAVTPSAGPGGGIAPGMAQTVQGGQTAVFTITPAPGFEIASVGGTCGGTLAGATFTTNVVTADCTVSAVFKRVGGVAAVPTLGEWALLLLVALLGMLGLRRLHWRA